MNRRSFLGTLAGGLLAAPLAGEAQGRLQISPGSDRVHVHTLRLSLLVGQATVPARPPSGSPWRTDSRPHELAPRKALRATRTLRGWNTKDADLVTETVSTG